MTRSIPRIVSLVAVLGCTAAFAQTPPQDVGRRHPNLRDAQRLVDRANQRIMDAQRANEWDLGGHAEKARELLVQASEELRKAAEVSNANH